MIAVRRTAQRWCWILLASCGGCSAEPTSPYSAASESRRETVRAEQLNQEAAGLLLSDPEKAEALLREALTADLFHGPAHNNLGVVYLDRGDLYEAANEFEWARKLMPGHPDPRMNLGLAVERAGRNADAIAAYESALEAYPGHVPTAQALASLTIRTASHQQGLTGLLEIVATAGESEQWRDWAKLQLARRPRSPE